MPSVNGVLMLKNETVALTSFESIIMFSPVGLSAAGINTIPSGPKSPTVAKLLWLGVTVKFLELMYCTK